MLERVCSRLDSWSAPPSALSLATARWNGKDEGEAQEAVEGNQIHESAGTAKKFEHFSGKLLEVCMQSETVAVTCTHKLNHARGGTSDVILTAGIKHCHGALT